MAEPSPRWTLEAVLDHLMGMMDERDRRYEQHFEGQERAVAAALAAQEKAVSAALGAAERAVLKAEVAAEKRFESQNEFRGQLSDQARLQMPRLEANVEFANIREKLDVQAARIANLEKNQNRGEGKSVGQNAFWGYLLGAVALVASLIAIFFKLSGGP